VTSRPQHRGPAPEDAELFAPVMLPRLRAAADEAIWLIGRGYSLDSAISIVGGHHQLAARQRLFLKRAVCSDEQRIARATRRRETLEGDVVRVDGFNLIITLEVALSGGLVFTAYDGALRDIAGLRGSYRMVEETERAIDLGLHAIAQLGPRRVEILLDAPVSNSGRLRARLDERAASMPFECDVTLDPSPDARLAGDANVVSADAVVIDRCASWIALANDIVTRHVPGAFHVALW
jgi:hypothetical protein